MGLKSLIDEKSMLMDDFPWTKMYSQSEFFPIVFQLRLFEIAKITQIELGSKNDSSLLI